MKLVWKMVMFCLMVCLFITLLPLQWGSGYRDAGKYHVLPPPPEWYYLLGYVSDAYIVFIVIYFIEILEGLADWIESRNKEEDESTSA